MIDLKELLKAGVHFGHRTSRWSPKMKPYIWGAKNKIHLIDIAKTAFLLDRATKFIRKITSDGGSILWVGTKKAAREIIKKTASSLDMPYVIHRWVGGTLSNFGQIKKAITRLLYLQEIVSKPSPTYSKKELSSLHKEITRLEKNVGGILHLSYPPTALIIVDAKKERSSITEALRLKIPIIAIVDTNTDPTDINFVIPANDDAPRSIACIIDKLAAMAQEGKNVWEEKEAKRKAAEEIESIESKVVKKTPKKATAEEKQQPETVTIKEKAPEKQKPTETKKIIAKEEQETKVVAKKAPTPVKSTTKTEKTTTKTPVSKTATSTAKAQKATKETKTSSATKEPSPSARKKTTTATETATEKSAK